MAKEFITEVEEKVAGGAQPVEITLGKKTGETNEDGTPVIERRNVLCHPPKEGQVAMMMARMGRHSSTPDKMAGIIDFFADSLDESDHQYVVDRLHDNDDGFGISTVTQIMQYLLEEWGKRPTK